MWAYCPLRIEARDGQQIGELVNCKTGDMCEKSSKSDTIFNYRIIKGYALEGEIFLRGSHWDLRRAKPTILRSNTSQVKSEQLTSPCSTTSWSSVRISTMLGCETASERPRKMNRTTRHCTAPWNNIAPPSLRHNMSRGNQISQALNRETSLVFTSFQSSYISQICHYQDHMVNNFLVNI